MIRFLCLGLWRDRSRSLFPLLTVIFGVMLTVVMFTWIEGFEVNFLQASARLGSGHVSVMSRAYAAEADQLPNDLALTGTADLLERLRREFPTFAWTPRIRFAGLLDIPDGQGETRVQGPMGGLGVDLFSGGSPEPGILDLKPALVSGSLPGKTGEILLAHDFASRLGIAPGAAATMIVGTMNGATSTANVTVAGTFRFGTPAMDRAMAIVDITDARAALDMDEAAGEIVGFFRAGFYDSRAAELEAKRFNALYELNGTIRAYISSFVSTDSHNMAAMKKMTTISTGRALENVSGLTTPVRQSITTTMGVLNATPKARNRNRAICT